MGRPSTVFGEMFTQNLDLRVQRVTRGSRYNIEEQARRQKFSEGGSFDTAGGFGAAQGSQKPLGIWCKI